MLCLVLPVSLLFELTTEMTSFLAKQGLFMNADQDTHEVAQGEDFIKSNRRLSRAVEFSAAHGPFRFDHSHSTTASRPPSRFASD